MSRRDALLTAIRSEMMRQEVIEPDLTTLNFLAYTVEQWTDFVICGYDYETEFAGETASDEGSNESTRTTASKTTGRGERDKRP